MLINSRHHPSKGYYLGARLFCNSNNMNYIGALFFLKELFNCSQTKFVAIILVLFIFFLRLEEEYWRSPFLINFIGVIFEAGNETREKIWSDFGAEQK